MIKQITKEFTERVPEIDYEVSWAILNGLVISYLKAQGQCFDNTKNEFKEEVKKVILSLPKYEYGFGSEFKFKDTYKAYLNRCPQELVEGLSFSDINEENVMKIAEKVVRFSAEKGVQEDGKMKIPDRGVHENLMQEFEETAFAMSKLPEEVWQKRGEEAVATVKEFFKQQAEKAVDAEIKFHEDNANYIVKFYSGILLYSKQEEGAASV